MNFRKIDNFLGGKGQHTEIRTSKVENENIESQKIINLRKVFSTKIELLKIEDEVNSSIENFGSDCSLSFQSNQVLYHLNHILLPLICTY